MRHRRRAAGTPTTPLERFVAGTGPVPDPAVVARHLLEGVAYLATDGNHPCHARWRVDYLDLVKRHLMTRALIAELVGAWSEAGVETVLLKGFYLAEAVYASPAERRYTDVDVLIAEGSGDRARAIAVSLGWVVVSSRLGPVSSSPYSHMELVLERDGVSVDVHRFVVHNSASDQRLARRFTAAAWEASRLVPWAGATVRHLDPRDCAITGLLLARSWSIDMWHLKATDYRDLEVLATRQGLDREALVRRARELRCERTVAIMLRRCDPWLGRLDLDAPRPAERLAWALSCWPERAGGRRRPFALRRRGVTLRSLARALPAIARARRLVHRGVDPDALLAALGAMPRPTYGALTPAERVALFSAVRMLASVAQPSGDRCVLRSLALFETLRSHGDDVELCIGQGGEVPTPRSHAWVRYVDATLPHAETWPACAVRVVTHAIRAAGDVSSDGGRGPQMTKPSA